MYQALDPALVKLRGDMAQLNEAAARRRLRQIERNFQAIVEIDFFPGGGQERMHAKLDELRASVNLRFSPQEPGPSRGAVTRRERKAFRCRQWATRRRLWVDRVASAWLIRRFIDPDAAFLWLEKPSDCPPNAHGFDFAAGFESVLAGLRESTPDDDALLAGITPVLDALHRHFSRIAG